ncbi:RNA methyltransferase, partial [Plasmodium cynomolgi strain B]
VKKIVIVFSDFANKSYESSRVLKNEEIKNALQLGLEQAMCTQFPEVFIHYSFSSFVMNMDRYSDEKTIKLCAHTEVRTSASYVEREILCRERGKILLMVGCERGFSELEIYLIRKLEFRFFNLTERILKCETALLVIIGQLLLLTENEALRPSGRKMLREGGEGGEVGEVSHVSGLSNVSGVSNASGVGRHNGCASSEQGPHGPPTENGPLGEIKKLLATEPSFPHQLVKAVNDFINSTANHSDALESNPCDEQKNGNITGGTSDIDTLLRSIHTLSSNKDKEENFENIYLSLLLKKIKYKNKFIQSYTDQQNNVDDDGVFIYRTQPYVSKKKKARPDEL